jgi:hypothetical protein
MVTQKTCNDNIWGLGGTWLLTSAFWEFKNENTIKKFVEVRRGGNKEQGQDIHLKY